MSEHKHAAVFEAAMRGKADLFEANFLGNGSHTWAYPAEAYLEAIYRSPSEWETRRKQKTHVVNGFTVPEPLRFDPEFGATYFIEASTSIRFIVRLIWSGAVEDRLWLKRGIAHATKEGAIANCKARLGIDPYKD